MGGGKLVLTAFEWLSGKKEKNGEQSRRPITIASFFFIYLFFIIYFWPHRAVAELFIYPLDYVMYSFHSRPRFGTLFDPLRVWNAWKMKLVVFDITCSLLFSSELFLSVSWLYSLYFLASFSLFSFLEIQTCNWGSPFFWSYHYATKLNNDLVFLFVRLVRHCWLFRRWPDSNKKPRHLPTESMGMSNLIKNF